MYSCWGSRMTVALADLDDLPVEHHRDAVADVMDDRHVVRDEQVAQVELVLVGQQVEDLGLDRDVEGEVGSSQTISAARPRGPA